MMPLQSLAALPKTLEKPPTRLEIEPAGRFEFSYTKVRTDTDEAIWRWPPTDAKAKGVLVDISV